LKLKKCQKKKKHNKGLQIDLPLKEGRKSFPKTDGLPKTQQEVKEEEK